MSKTEAAIRGFSVLLPALFLFGWLCWEFDVWGGAPILGLIFGAIWLFWWAFFKVFFR
jgi:hypothetical protein